VQFFFKSEKIVLVDSIGKIGKVVRILIFITYIIHVKGMDMNYDST